MDQWRRQRLRQPWCEGQVTATFLPGAARGLREGGGTGLRFWDLHSVVLLPPLGSTPSRTGGFLGTTSPGPMAELYGAANQDSGVSSYISAASPAPSTGFGHSLGVSVPWRALRRGRMMAGAGEGAASPRGDGGEQGEQAAFWLGNATCRATAEPHAACRWCRVQQLAGSLLPWAPLVLPSHDSRS